MHPNFHLSSVIPPGLTIESVRPGDETIVITAKAVSSTAACPLCNVTSRRIHSRYLRHVSDLPCTGRGMRLRIVARRFRCQVPHCRRQIFTERFDSHVLGSRCRRTSRLDCVVHHLGLALGGRPGASFAKRLMLPVSNDTLLRVVRRQSHRPAEPLRVVGIDDWAEWARARVERSSMGWHTEGFRRNHRYGGIVCDLERRRIVTLLPDRDMATVEAWLARHPSIEVVSRDRGGGYGEAATKALPHAVQVADRWHLMGNAGTAFLDAVRKSMRAIRTAIGATVINPELLTSAERLQYEGYLRREDTYAVIMKLAKDGVPIK